MIHAATERLIWKEYRAQRGLWFAMLLMVLTLQSLMLLIWGGLGSEEVQMTAYLGLVFVLSFAIACGTTLFGSEREDRSSIFLQSFPISPWRLVVARVAFGFISTLCLLLVQQLVFSILVRSFGGANSSWDLITSGFVFSLALLILKAILWGVLFSLIFGRVLVAVGCSTALTFGVLVSRIIYTERTYSQELASPHEVWLYPWLDLMMIVMLFLLDVAIYRKWSRGELQIRWFQRAEMKPVNVWQKIITRQTKIDYNRNSIRSLLWLCRKEVRSACLVPVIVAVAICLFGILLGNLLSDYYTLGFSIFIIPLIPIFMGVWVYRENHLRHTYRFCVEKGVSPKKFWIVKQCVWFSATVFILLVFFLVDTYFEKMFFWERLIAPSSSEREYINHLNIDITQFRFPNPYNLDRYPNPSYSIWKVIAAMLQYCLFAYCCAMWCSHWFRRTIPALLSAIVAVTLLHIWWLFTNWIELSIVWTVYPLVFALLYSSYHSTQDWMLERARLIRVLRTAGSLVGTFAVVVSIVAWQRISTAPPFVENNYYQRFLPAPPSEYELETGKMYRRAVMELVRLESIEKRHAEMSPTKNSSIDTYRTNKVIDAWEDATESEKEWWNENQAALQKVIEASKRTGCALYNPSESDLIGSRSQRWELYTGFAELQTLLLLSARKLEHEGKLHDAWDHYLVALRMGQHFSKNAPWSFRDQSSEVFSWIQNWIKYPLQRTKHLELAFQTLKKMKLFEIEIGAEAALELAEIERNYEKYLEYGIDDSEQSDAKYVPDLQLERALHFATIKLLPWEKVRAKRIVNATNRERFFTHVVKDRVVVSNNFLQPSFSYQRKQHKIYEERNRIPAPALFDLLGLIGFWHEVILESPNFDIEAELHNRKNIALLLLALQIEKRLTGKLPARLEDLRGKYFEKLPIDPWSGESFKYYHQGLPNDLKYEDGQIKANTPFIFTLGYNELYWEEKYRIEFIPKSTQYNNTGQDYYTVIGDRIEEGYEQTKRILAREGTIRQTIHTIEK